MKHSIQFSINIGLNGKEVVDTTAKHVDNLAAGFGKARRANKEFATSFTTLAAKMEIVGRMAEQVRGLADSYGTLSREMQKAASLTGLGGADLAGVKAQAEGVARAFGGDVSEVLRSAGNLAQGFGISATDALKLVKQGFAAGADSQGEFLDILREYPRYFKEAGLSASDFINITAHASQMGIYSDKGVDTIKEGNLRLREMTKATKDALNGIGLNADEIQAKLQAGSTTTFAVIQQVAAKLKELPPSASAVGTALADIFGGPGEDAGLEYVKSLADVKTGLTDLSAQATQSGQALSAQADAYTAVAKVTNTVAAAVQQLDAATGGGISLALQAAAALGDLSLSAFATAKAVEALRLKHLAASAASAVHAAAQKALALATRLCAAAAREARLLMNGLAAAQAAYAAGAGAATAATIAFRAALRSLLITTGIGIAIAAVTEAINLLVSSFDKGADAATDFSRETAKATETVRNSDRIFRDTQSQTMADLLIKYKELQNQWKELKKDHEKTAWIARNAQAFRDLGLRVTDVASAESIFEKNTAAVEESFNRRAEAAARAARKVELYKEKLDLESSLSHYDTAYSHRQTGRDVRRNPFKEGETVQAAGIKNGRQVNGVNPNTLRDLGIPQYEAKRDINGQLIPHRYTKQEAYKLNHMQSGGSFRKEQQARLNRVNEQISEDDDWQRKHPATTYTPHRSGGGGGGGTPAAVKAPAVKSEGGKSLPAGRQVAATPEAPTALQTATEEMGKLLTEGTRGKETYGELEAAVQAFAAAQKTATDPQTWQFWQGEIDTAQYLMKQMRGEIEKPYTPPEEAEIRTLEELDRALQYYQAKQQTAQASEQAGIQKTIGELQQKREAILYAANAQQVIDTGKADLNSFSGLKGSELRTELKLTGYDGFMAKIRELQKEKRKLQENNKGGANDGQIAEIDSLSRAYSKLAAQSAKTWDTFKSGWSSLEGIGNGIRGITSAIEEDADAWTVITSVVDGFIQIGEGIASIVKIIQMLTAAHGAAAAATTTDAAAATSDAGAKAADAAASSAAAGAKAGEAVAGVTSSGAKLPFPMNLVAIAAGLAVVMSALALMKSFSTGGIVGGSSKTGDKILARVNSGEMILNLSQQRRLLALLNGSGIGGGGYLSADRQALAAVKNGRGLWAAGVPPLPVPRLDASALRSAVQPAAAAGTIEMRLRGRDLVGSLANGTRVSSKSGKRTGIVI